MEPTPEEKLRRALEAMRQTDRNSPLPKEVMALAPATDRFKGKIRMIGV